MTNLKKIITTAILIILSQVLLSCGGSNDANTEKKEQTTVSLGKTITFEDGAKYTFTDFDGGGVKVIDNPHKDGINKSAKVARMIKDGGEKWGGSSLKLDQAIDFSKGNTFKMKVYSTREVPVLLKLEGLKDDDSAGGADYYSEKQVTHGGGGWQELTFALSKTDIFANNNDPAKKITLIFDNGTVGAHASTPKDWIFYFDDISQQQGSTNSGDSFSITLPVDFEQNADNYTFTNFDGGALSVVNNPYKTGINTSNQVARMVKDGGQPWGGSFFILDNAIDFSSQKAFTLKVWSAREVPVLLKFENASSSNINAEVTTNHPGGSAWQELSFDFTGKTDALTTITKVVLIFDNGTIGSGGTNWTFYIDDLTQTAGGKPPTPPAAPTDAPAAPTLPPTEVTSIYSDAYTDVASNPNPGWSEVSNDETIAGNTVKKSENFSPFDLSSAIDVSRRTTFHVDVWSETGEVNILVKLVPSSGAANEGLQTITKDNINAKSWTRLEFPLTAFTSSGNFDLSNIKQVLVDQTPDAIVYYDNIYFSGDSTASSTTLPVDFEQNANDYTFTNFYGGALSVVNNPYKTGTNTSNQVARMVKNGGQPWGGSFFILDNAIDFSSQKTFTLKVWSTREVPVLLKFENASSSSINAEVTTNHPGGSAWQELSFDFTGKTDSLTTITKVVLIFDNGTIGSGGTSWTFYIDDLTQTAGGKPLTPPAAPTDAPAAPTLPPTEVTSIYSDAYTDVASNPNPGWSEVSNDETIAGNTVKKSENFSPFDLSSAIDVSRRTTFHVDVWSETGEVNILVKLVPSSGAANEGLQTITKDNINAKSWTRLEFPLSGFTSSGSFDLSDIKQVLVDQTPDAIVYYDNIYFSGDSTASSTSTKSTASDSVSITLPVDFEQNANDYTFTNFDGGALSVVQQPLQNRH